MGDKRSVSVIDQSNWYTVREAAKLLDERVTPETLRSYCRGKKVKCKKLGPKREWHVSGQSLLQLRRDWQLD